MAQTFTPAITYASSPASFALAFGHVVGAARPDLVTNSFAFPLPSTFQLWPNGGGTCPLFGAPAFVPVSSPTALFPGFGAVDIAVAAIDATPGDEILTLDHVGGTFGSVLRVWTGVVAGTPGNPTPLPTGSSLQLLVRDFDGDGDDDVLVPDVTGNLWLHRNVAGVLQLALVLPLAPGPGPAVRFAVGSFDGDALPDLVVLWGGTGTQVPAQAQVLRNTTSGGVVSFGPPHATAFPTGVVWPVATSGTVSITTGDFNADGSDDFVVGGGRFTGRPELWLCRVPRTAAGWPTQPTTLPAPLALPDPLPANEQPTAVTSGDFDLDGDLDLAYTTTQGALHVRLQNSNGTFGLGEQVLPGTIAYELEAYDIDGDGDLDLGATGSMGTLVFCNGSDAGACHHVLRAGVADGYAPGVQGIALTEVSSPRAQLGPAPRVFDVVMPATHFAHTFAALPDRIVAAELDLALGPDVANGNIGDTIQLDFGPPGPELGFACTMPVPFHSADGVLRLDLAHLPGGLNLLPRLSASHRLDVRIGTNTKVDHLRLELVTACAGHVPALRLDALGGVDTFDADSYPSTGAMHWQIDAGPGHGNGIAVLGFAIDSTPMIGCVPFEGLGLTSLDILSLQLLDANGRAAGMVPLGIGGAGTHVSLQVAAFEPSLSWSMARWSETLSDYVY